MKKFINTKKVIVAATILTIVLFVFPLSSFAGPKGDKGDWEGCVISNKGDIPDLVFDFVPPVCIPGSDDWSLNECSIVLNPYPVPQECIDLKSEECIAVLALPYPSGYGLALPLDLELDLGLPIDPVYVTTVEVQARGEEKASITPFDGYIYESTLKKGWKHSQGPKHSKKGILIAYGVDEDGISISPLVFEFKEARLFESFLLPNDGVLGEAGEEECEKGRIDPEADKYIDPTTLQLYFEAKKTKLVDPPMSGSKFNLVLKIDAGIIVTNIIEPLPH